MTAKLAAKSDITTAKLSSKKCPICGKGMLHSVTGEFRTQFEDDNGNHKELVVPQVSYNKCDTCGEEILDDVASAKISQAQRVAMGLLSSDEIRNIRQGLGKTQREMSNLLGIGEKTYCRWESGGYFQSEAFDRYLRLLRKNPDAVRTLERIRDEKQGQSIFAVAENEFPDLENLEVYEASSIQFSELLRTGPFYSA
jgi:putative zinc finger/helix-turn-helix YgiT family protein